MYLNNHSYYSLRYGTLSLENLIGEAKALGVPALALTDINNSMGMIDFVRMCNEHSIKPIAGIEFRNGNDYLFEYAYIIYPFGYRSLASLQENEYIGVKPSEIGRLFSTELFYDQSKLVMWNPVTFKDKSGYILHKNLRAIDNNTLISKLSLAQIAGKDEMMMPHEVFLSFYEDHPEIIRNTEKLLADCSIDFPNIRSIHAGGILISEEPITCYTALDLPPKGFPTTQWDMYVAEAIGFEKFDILSQRGIGHIKECVDVVAKNRRINVDVHRVADFKRDHKESFAGYSFSKAHSASYAVESYQSIYLKAYFPLEFMVAVINNFGGFYQTWVYFNEAQRQGAQINLPCVNHGQYKTSIIGKDIFIGFIHITNLETKISRAIALDRDRRGIFKGLEDFIERIQAPLDQMITLIRVGALRFTGRTKAQLLWEVHLFFGKARKVNYAGSLFNASIVNYRLPELKHEKLEDAYDEFEFLGFPVTVSYFDMLETSYRGEVFWNFPRYVW